MDLYVKAGPDGSTLGDCPFAHYIRMVLHVKGLQCNVHPCSSDQKPKWLLDNFEGKMPCLDDNGERKVDSSTIVAYIDRNYPDPQMLDCFDKDLISEAEKAISHIFPALATFLKAQEFNFFSEKSLLVALKNLEQFLASSSPSSSFLLGDRISLLDCSLLPKLYVLDEGLRHFYPETRKKIFEGDQFSSVVKYMERSFQTEAFKATKYPVEVMIWGWENARKDTTKACDV